MKRSYLIKLFTVWVFLTSINSICGGGLLNAAIVSAPTHSSEVEDVISIYSNQYGVKNGLDYPTGWGNNTVVGNTTDEGGKTILEFANFDFQPIQLNGNAFDPSPITHINVDVYFSFDVNNFNIKLLDFSGAERAYEYNYNGTIEGGSWRSFEIPLREFSQVKGEGSLEQVTYIQLSVEGQTGVTAYLDNIFFYNLIEAGKMQSAPVPARSSFSVDNLYSTKYGYANSLSYMDWGGGNTEKSTELDTNNRPILKFSNFKSVAIQYNPNEQIMEIKGNDYLHLDIYPETDIQQLEVTLLRYEDRIGNEQKIESKYIYPSSLTAGEWNSVDIDISQFIIDGEGYVSTIQLVSAGGSSTEIYVDHIYFYNSQDEVPIIGTPAFSAYMPPVRQASDVISVFSDSYTSGLPSGYPKFEVWGENQYTQTRTIKLGSIDYVWEFVTTNHLPIGLGGVDVSEMEYLHIDIYSPEATSVDVFLNGGGQNKALKQYITPEKWNRIDIPLSEFTGVELNETYYVGLQEGGNNTFFVDNVYFYKKQAPSAVSPIGDINDALGKGINLGNIYDQSSIPWSDNYIQQVKDLGFKHVRLPVRWDYENRSLQYDPYNIDQEFMNTIRDIVDKTLAAGLKIVVNMHHYDPLIENPAAERERFISMWGQIGEYFQNYPEDLVFELLNEPRDHMTVEIWSDLSKEALDKVRETNPTRAVMIGSGDWGTVNGLKGLIIPEDDHLILTIHYYNPTRLTHQGAEWAGNYPRGYRWYDSKIERDAVDQDFAEIEKFVSENNNIPVHIGEFGSFNTADLDSRILWTTYVARTIEQHNYSFAYWDFGTDFGIYNIYTDEYNEPLIDAILTNPIPEEPANLTFTDEAVLYSSAEDMDHSRWNSGSTGHWTSSWENGKMIVSITNGGTGSWEVQPLLTGLNMEKGATYRVTFTVSSTGGDYTFDNYMGKDESPYTTYSNYNYTFPTGSTPKEISYYFTMLYESDASSRFAFDMGGKTGNNPVTVTFENIRIEKVTRTIPKSLTPEIGAGRVINVFSTFYDNNLTVTYPNTGQSTLKTEQEDSANKYIVKLENFDNQTISLGTILSLGDKKYLHLDVYPGSISNLVVTAVNNTTLRAETGEETTESYNYSLVPHKWNSIEIDLTDFLQKSGGQISSFILSGGSGEGRILYFDHVYFYSDDIVVGNTSDEIDDAITYRIDKNQFFIEAQDKIHSVEVFEVSGRLAFKNLVEENNVTVDLTSINSGVYFIRISYGSEEVKTIKFIKN